MMPEQNGSRKEANTLRKIFIILLILFSAITGMYTPAPCSVVGTWDVEGWERMQVNIKGEWSQYERISAYDDYTFNADGTFQMLMLSGTWRQQGKKFTIEVSTDSVASYFESFFSEVGLDTDVTVTKIKLSGKENKDDTIRGEMNVEMAIYFTLLDTEGKASASFNFKGTRAGQVSSPGTHEPLPSPKSILQAIQRKYTK